MVPGGDAAPSPRSSRRVTGRGILTPRRPPRSIRVEAWVAASPPFAIIGPMTTGASAMPGSPTGPLPMRCVRQARTLFDLWRAVERAVDNGRPADACLSRLIRDHPEFGSRDRRLYSETIFAGLRWRGWVGRLEEDRPRAPVLAALLDHGRRLPAALEYLAEQAGIDPALWPDPSPDSLEGRGAALRPFLGRVPVPRDLVPDWVPGALAAPPPAEPMPSVDRVIAAFQERPPLWLRAVGIGAAELTSRLNRAGVRAAIDARMAGAVRCAGAPHLATVEKRTGPCFEVQDLASQAVVAACAARGGQRWWDACAGGGGKTLGLLASGEGIEALATDIRPRALRNLARRAGRLGLKGSRTLEHDAAAATPVGSPFDGVLVDAPCSGLGTWSRNPDARWRTSAGDVPRLAALQARMLDTAASAVRPGGWLVFSVCTLTRPETVERVEAFDLAHPEFEPDPFRLALTGDAPVARQWVWPWLGPCGGMFIARWRRRPSVCASDSAIAWGFD